ncbi:GntR family transcriptional regulator [Devriesea agamarum]|uniref:GntR family transcriptional regulator n=1 Tax=Devriesea agamarum TaxID=472569 RepID=UPI00071C77E7|nr:GntR family transcriptional regulator [Devriesea agamarum]
MKYVRVQAYLRGLLEAGLMPGDAIPSERSLCERFEVSRMTVRQAVDAMVNEGLLVRVQGKGTFVAQPRIDLQPRIQSFSQEMRSRGMIPSSKVLTATQELASVKVAASLGLEVGAPVYLVRRIRLADGIPVADETTWLPAELLPGLIATAVPFSLHEELEERGYAPTWGEDVIEAVVLDDDGAEVLSVECGSPALKISRRTFAESVPVLFSVSYYRGDKYTLWVPIAGPTGSRRAGMRAGGAA